AGRVKQSGAWWVNLSTGAGFVHTLWTQWSGDQAGILDWVDVQVGDFNGDGRSDLVGRVKQSGAWWVALSSGAGFVNQPWTAWSPDQPGLTWADVRKGNVS